VGGGDGRAQVSEMCCVVWDEGRANFWVVGAGLWCLITARLRMLRTNRIRDRSRCRVRRACWRSCRGLSATQGSRRAWYASENCR